MPGPRPIDTRQSSGGIHNLKQQINNLQTSSENKSVDIFSTIPNLTGSGNLVFDSNPILNNPQLSNVTKIITKETITYTTNIDQVIFSFPLYEGQQLDRNSVIGAADIIIQSEASNIVVDSNGIVDPATDPSLPLNNTMPPVKTTLKQIIKMLVTMVHDYGNNPQVPDFNKDQYAGVHIVSPGGGGAGDVSTYDFTYNQDTKTFDLLATPAVSKVIKHKICAICMISSEQDWKQ